MCHRTYSAWMAQFIPITIQWQRRHIPCINTYNVDRYSDPTQKGTKICSHFYKGKNLKNYTSRNIRTWPKFMGYAWTQSANTCCAWQEMWHAVTETLHWCLANVQKGIQHMHLFVLYFSWIQVTCSLWIMANHWVKCILQWHWVHYLLETEMRSQCSAEGCHIIWLAGTSIWENGQFSFKDRRQQQPFPLKPTLLYPRWMWY